MSDPPNSFHLQFCIPKKWPLEVSTEETLGCANLLSSLAWNYLGATVVTPVAPAVKSLGWVRIEPDVIRQFAQYTLLIFLHLLWHMNWMFPFILEFCVGFGFKFRRWIHKFQSVFGSANNSNFAWALMEPVLVSECMVGLEVVHPWRWSRGGFDPPDPPLATPRNRAISATYWP